MSEQNKIAVVIYEPASGDTARIYRGLKTAAEFANAGDDVVVLFDGSGVEALAAVSDPGNPMNGLIDGIRPTVIGACKFCAISHKVRDDIERAGWPLVASNGGEASIRDLVNDGRQVLTY
ncbi:hypothetical protein GCM10022200_29890 [Microbacterium awajiense]|uniref:Sulfur reduction protein DsrE n=1 Tax=Microbacterium awajiense TaxID=415214 RepID=A0ABP7AZ27_9MICO